MDSFAIGPFSSLFVVALRKTLGFEAGSFGQDSELRRVDSVRPCAFAFLRPPFRAQSSSPQRDGELNEAVNASCSHTCSRYCIALAFPNMMTNGVDTI